MKEKTKQSMQTAVNALIERFDDLEAETGSDFTFTKRVIMNWAKKYKLFDLTE